MIMPCIFTCTHKPLIRQIGLGVPAAAVLLLVVDLNMSATDLRASACPEFSLYLLISDDTKSFCDCNKKQIMLSKCPFQSCCKIINDKLLFEKNNKNFGSAIPQAMWYSILLQDVDKIHSILTSGLCSIGIAYRYRVCIEVAN